MNNTANTGTQRRPLKDLSQEEIMRIFDSDSIKNKSIIIPIGFPQAGKSMFLSSLMYYCDRPDSGKLWTDEPLFDYPFDRGELSKKVMVQFFEEKKGIPSTPSGTIDIIGLTVNPIKKLPKLETVFVDFAGEDLKEIAISLDGKTEGKFNDKIEGVLRGCSSGNPIFCLITPYKPIMKDSEEDQLHFRFISYLKSRLPKLYDKSKFIVVVSHWDKVTDKNLTVDQYIKTKRPKLDSMISNTKDYNVYYMDYSVGEVENVKNDDGQDVVYIRNISAEYPHKLWNKLYTVVTGKNFEGLTGLALFIKKLLG